MASKYSHIRGFKELSAQLDAMGKAPSGQALRNAAMSAMLPAQEAARAAAPRGSPPYGPYESRKQPFDPYPKKTYKGRRVAPGFASRNVARRAFLNNEGSRVRVSLGVRSEAFYALQFIELGTSKIPKRPWLEPSFRASQDAVEFAFHDRLVELIDRAAKTKRPA